MESHQPRPGPQRVSELKKAALSGVIPQGEGSFKITEERARQLAEERDLREQAETSRTHGELIIEQTRRSVPEPSTAPDSRHEEAEQPIEVFGLEGFRGTREAEHPTQELEATEQAEEESDEEEVTPEKAEEKRKEALSEVRNVLAELEQEQNPGASPARVLKPVKRMRKNLGATKHPRLLNVRQPNLALKGNLTRSVKGHVESDRTEGWVMPVYTKGNVPEPEYFYDRKENEDFAPWTNHLVLTPDGRIFYSFVRADEVFGNDARPGELALTEDSVKKLDDLTLKELETIKKYLNYHLGSAEQPTEIHPRNASEEGSAVDEETQLRDRLAAEQARAEEARRQLEEQETEALSLPLFQRNHVVKVASASGEIEEWRIAGTPEEHEGRTVLFVQKVDSTETKFVSIEELARLNAR